jgi:hypothetical protein
MRWLLPLGLIVLLGCATSSEPRGGRSKIIKVLPHYLDKDGVHTLSPSLYERDAYQYRLRRNPEMQEGVVFHVRWQAAPAEDLRLELELQGNRENQFTSKRVQSDAIRHPGGREWIELALSGDELRELGRLIAWRATIWNGTSLLAEQRSFLW